MKHNRFDFAPRPEAKALLLEAKAVDLATAPDLMLLRQEPPMTDVDEAVFLLHTAAEIEHSLLAEYLYAAYSLSATTEPQKTWRDILIGIAREEMGHLLSVQNILHALGGPINFEREDYPYREFYPFPFELEPFSLKSVAKYVLAEMPDISQIPVEIGFNLDEVKQDAGVPAASNVINRVGLLYETLIALVEGLQDSAFHADSLNWQAGPQEWAASALNLIIRTVDNRAAAATLLEDIGRQGEGATEPAGGRPSHFRRFFDLYKQVRALGPEFLSANMLVNPNTHEKGAPGYISNEKIRLWAHLFNLRYRVLLIQFVHYIQMRNDLQPEKGYRSRLRVWCIEEMRFYLSGLAARLIEMPQHDPPEQQPLEELQQMAWPTQPLRVWTQDESRFGLITIHRRRLTLRGIKPLAPSQHELEWSYLYGCVEPCTGKSFFLPRPARARQ